MWQLEYYTKDQNQIPMDSWYQETYSGDHTVIGSLEDVLDLYQSRKDSAVYENYYFRVKNIVTGDVVLLT